MLWSLQTFAESFPLLLAACSKHQSAYSIWKASDICLIINRVRITTQAAAGGLPPQSRVSDTSGPALTLSRPAHDSWSSWSLPLFTDPPTVCTAIALSVSLPALRMKIMSVCSFWNPDNQDGRIVTARISKMFVTVCKSNKSNTLYGSRLTIPQNALIVNWNDSNSNYETKGEEISQAVNTLLFVISPDFRALRAALYWFAGWLVYAEMKSINPSLPDADTRMGEMPTEIESSSDSSQAHR